MRTTDSHQFHIKDGRPYKVAASGIHYHPDTAAPVIEAIDRLIRTGARVRVFLGDTASGAAWGEENDCHGTLGHSTGPLRSPLIIAPRADGGPHLLDHCVVGLLTNKNIWAYKHPSLDLGNWEVKDITSTHGATTYVAETWCNGELHGRHKTRAQAERLQAFMTGKRMTP